MASENFIGQMASDLGVQASVKNVFGAPVQCGNKTILPVAKIGYGFGGGSGQRNAQQKNEAGIGDAEKKALGEGAGGGGGLMAKPLGVYEIGPAGTRFVPANRFGPFMKGVICGLLMQAFLFSKRSKER